MNRSQENSSPNGTGERLRVIIPEILQSWESDVRRELPVVQLFESSILRNTLPIFLERLARRLEDPKDGGACEGGAGCAEHGRERAKLANYSAEQVLEEYRYLRKRVLNGLRRLKPLHSNELELINDSFEQAAIEAVGAFTRQLRQAKEAVRHSELRYRELVEQAPFAISILKGPHLVYEAANEAEERLVARGPLVGRSLREVFPEPEFEGTLARLEEVLRTGQTFTSRRMRVPQTEGEPGEERFFHVVYQALQDERGEFSRVLALSVEVGPLAQKEGLRAVLNLIPIPVVLVEPGSGRYLFSNRAAERLYGGSLPTDLALESARLELEDPSGHRLSKDRYPSNLAAKGETLTGHEVIWHTRTGRYHLSVFSETVRLPEGDAVVVLPFVDVSQLKQAEQALAQALAARNELISFIGHELRTPLTGLLLQLQLLEHLAGRSPSEMLPAEMVLKSLQPAIRQTTRLQELIDRLLDLSRIQNNRLHLEISAVDLCSLVGDIVDRLAIQAKAAGSSVELMACKELFVYVDALRIEQVVANLVTNALKYGAGKPVKVAVFEHGENAVIEVCDQGIGISKEDRERIFRRFERATEAKRSESLGIGLYISYQIVLAHGGRFEIESEPGEGSLFRVVIPAKRIEPSVLP